MTPPKDDNIVAAFMMEGLRDTDKYTEILEAWQMGALELVSDMVSYAPYTWRLCEAAQSVGLEFPGVFDYEVSAPFGMWFGKYVLEHSFAPDRKECTDFLLQTVFAFFTPDGTTLEEIRVLSTALKGVNP